MAARRKPATKPAEKQDGDAVSSKAKKANILPMHPPGPQMGVPPPFLSPSAANEPAFLPIHIEYFNSAIEAFKAESAAKVRAQDAETDQTKANTEAIRHDTQRLNEAAEAALPSPEHKANMEKQNEMDRVWTRRLVILGVCTSFIGSIVLTVSLSGTMPVTDKMPQIGAGMMVGGAGGAVIRPLWRRIAGWISKEK